MPEVRIKTDFGEIVVPYNDQDELKKGLTDIEKIVEIVNDKLVKLKRTEREVKPGYEKIYKINEDRTVSILKPSGKTENIGIVLFAYDPAPLKTDFLYQCSGVKRPHDFMKNSKYFENLDQGYYKLSSEGLSWITKICSSLKEDTKEK